MDVHGEGASAEVTGCSSPCKALPSDSDLRIAPGVEFSDAALLIERETSASLGRALASQLMGVSEMTDSMDRNEPGAGIILVVDDEPIIREFVCEILQDEGFETVQAADADVAKAFLDERAGEVCLLLTDILMPGSMNGAELSNLSHELWPQIPILVMSGHETPESSGVAHPVTFIRKPWTIGQMLDGVEKALGRG